VSVGLNHQQLHDFLSYCRFEDKVQVAIFDHVTVHFSNDAPDGPKKWAFGLRILNINRDRFFLPGKTYTVKVTFSSRELKRIVYYVEPVGQFIRVTATRQ
jgi:hypothetical protein